MKKLITLIIIVSLLSPGIWAEAHTGLDTSTPKEGDILTEPLQGVMLSFETEIESLSTLKLVHSEETEIPLNNLIVNGNTMKADLNQKLENGNYTIVWKIVGNDGHTIEGKVNFVVQLEQQENQVEEGQGTEQPEKQGEQLKDRNDENSQVKSSGESTFFPILIFGLVIILIVSFLIVRKKK